MILFVGGCCGELAAWTLWRGFFILCLKLGWVLTLERRFSLFVSEVELGSDSGAPFFSFCVRSRAGF
ncbi:hypothetical protein CHI10_04615 [Bacillus sp. 7894-2]|nr:hypothetical protein CHI10_04615 [Bacillus sp. 7894-2]